MSENVVLFKLNYNVIDEYKLQLNSYDRLWCRPQYQALHLAVQNLCTWWFRPSFYILHTNTEQTHHDMSDCNVMTYIKVTSKVTVRLGHDTVPLGNWFRFQRTVVPSSSKTCSGPSLHTWPHSHLPDWPINLSSQSWTGHTALRFVPLPVLSGILLKAFKMEACGPLKCWELITQQCPKRTGDSKI